MENKIKLYTCESGYKLFNDGEAFFGWYKEEGVEKGDIPFLVSERYIGHEELIGVNSDAEFLFDEIVE